MSTISLGNLAISRDRFDVTVSGRTIELTYVEFELLFALARNAGKVISRSRLIQAVWHEAETDDDRKLTVHMSRLRKKLSGSDPWQIETYTKRGYALMNKRRATTADARPPDATQSAPPLGGVI